MNKLLAKYQHITVMTILLLFGIYYCAVKMIFVSRFFGGSIGAEDYFSYYILKHDAGLLAVCVFIYFLTLFLELKFLKSLLRMLIIALGVVYIVDFYILRYFTVRLSSDDVLNYAPHTFQFIAYLFVSVFSVLEKTLFVLFMSVFIIASGIFMIVDDESMRKYKWIVGIVVCMLFGFYLMPEKKEYLHAWVYQNALEYNLKQTAQKPYSDDFAEKLLRDEERINEEVCVAKPARRKNIVVVLLESFSPYHSQFFSGLNDLTPELDRIARENQSFHNFYANGFNSGHALVGIILGVPPIPAAYQAIYTDGNAGFERFYDFPNALPERLNDQGYDAEFMTTGDLSFSKKGNWLRNTGFQYIEGHEHPFYNEGWPRYHFKSAPDEALYMRALDRIINVERNKPYFLMLETVSTHHPYVDPRDGSRSEFGAIEYADYYLGRFYDGLKKHNFFDNGILIVVSDHHSMLPIKKEEWELFGDRAQALVPMIVADGTFSARKVQLPFQQLDVHSSVINYVSSQKCTSLWKGDFLNDPLKVPEYVLFVSGNNRDVVEVYTPEQTGQVKMNGDQTNFIQKIFPQKEIIVDKINYERIRRYR